jgi:predicted transposase YdaD
MPEVARVRESLTYQAILEEGRAEGRIEGWRSIMLRLGSQRFGPPDTAVWAQLEAIRDVATLDRLGQRLLSAASWDELLATP